MASPKRNERALLRLETLLLRKPRSIEELAERLGINERSVYRWLGYLEEAGCDVVRRKKIGGEVLFSVING